MATPVGRDEMSDTPSRADPAPATTQQDTPAAAVDDVDPAEAARLKREARKARILSKGSDRLARITNTGRGEGASAYLKDNTPSLPSTPQPDTNSAATLGVRADDEDPMEVDISTIPRHGPPRGEQATNPFAMFGGAEGSGQAGNPMEALMAMMQNAGGGPGGPGAPGGGGQPDLPPQLAAMMQQFGAGAGGPGGAGGANFAPTVVQTKSIIEKAFDLLQAFLVVALAVLAAKSSLFDFDRSSTVPETASSAFDTTSPAFLSSEHASTLRRWARLGYQRPSAMEWASIPPASSSFLPFDFIPAGMSTLPLFWIFLSLEILLQAARIVIVSRKTPAPPSMLATLTSMLPIPNLHLAIKLIGKYLALINALINDISLLVFVFGVAVLWSGHKLGGIGMLNTGAIPGLIHDEL